MKFEINIGNILMITTIVLSILKLFGLISLTWLQVCMPVIILVIIEFGILILVGIVLVILFGCAIMFEPKETRKDKIENFIKELEKIKEEHKW